MNWIVVKWTCGSVPEIAGCFGPFTLRGSAEAFADYLREGRAPGECARFTIEKLLNTARPAWP